jgi:glutamyl endopeptidase
MKTTPRFTDILNRRILLCAVTLGSPLFMVEGASAQAAPASVSNLRNTNPYHFVGRFSMKQGTRSLVGSGTVIKPYSVLTAGHCLYARGTGWSSSVTFDRAHHQGTYASRSSASRLYILGGYQGAVDSGGGTSAYGFSRDTGGVVCFTRPMNGGYAGWWQNPTLLTGSAYNMSLGYGAAVHDGRTLLRSAPTRSFTQSYGSWYQNSSYGLEGGMSGGPVFAQSNSSWYVCAVNVSGPSSGAVNTGAGVRAIDTDTSNLIRNYLP